MAIIQNPFGRTISLAPGHICHLRQATRNDRPAIVQVIDSVAAERSYLPVRMYTPTTMWESALNGENGNGQTYLLLVAEIDHTVVGHMRLFPNGYAHSDRHVLDVGLVLRKDFRDLGIGTELLNLAADWAAPAGYRKLTGSILANNFRALHLFLGRGYHVEGRRQRQFIVDGSYLDEIIVGRLL